MKRYIVPVIHHVSFGCEVVVEAESIEEAKRLAVSEHAEMESGDGYDWDRMNFIDAELGDWAPVQEVDHE